MKGDRVHRICHVCSAHKADDGRVFGRSCVTLAESGYEVHLLARSSASEPYEERGVIVHPLPECASRLRRFARAGAVARMAAGVGPDLFHVHEPELLGPVLAAAGSRPVVYDVHESYLDILTDRDWVPRPIKPLLRAAWDVRERMLLKRCAAVLPVTDRVAERYRPLHPRVEILANYPELGEMTPLPAHERDGRTCVFIGTIHRNRGLLEAVSAIGILRRRGLDVPLIAAGKAPDEFMSEAASRAEQEGVADLFEYRGALPREEAIALANTGSIGLVLHLPRGNNLAAWPVRMMEFMALELPIVYTDLASHGTIAGGRDVGIGVDSTDPESIANAIERLVTDREQARRMGKAGRAATIEKFNWGVEKLKLLSLYEELLR